MSCHFLSASFAAVAPYTLTTNSNFASVGLERPKTDHGKQFIKFVNPKPKIYDLLSLNVTPN